MAERMALAAIRPLLGLICNEIQLLRGVRGDVRFIKDEMESVKGFLLNLVRTREGTIPGDHQVRAWMEQVMELAYDSRGCVEDYARSCRMAPRDGSWWRGCLVRRIKWVKRLPRRTLVRRRIAARIRLLKVRAREISERQQRYAVAFPPLPKTTDEAIPAGVVAVDYWNHHRRRSTHPPKDSPRWAVLSGPDNLTEAKEELLEWLKVKKKDQDQDYDHTLRPWPSVLAVVTKHGFDGASLADQMYKRCTDDSACADDLIRFDRVVRITIQRPPSLLVILFDMLLQLHPADQDHFKSMGENDVVKKLKESLGGKRLLLLLSDMDYPALWDDIKPLLGELDCPDGSAVVFSTNDKELAGKCCPDEANKKYYSLVHFYLEKAVSLLPMKLKPRENQHLRFKIRRILAKCTPDVYCMNLLLHALLSNPNRTVQELESLFQSLAPDQCSTKIERQNRMVNFCYHGLHKEYQNCLWYTTVFARGIFKVRKGSLLRRWVAEGLITVPGQSTAMDEAERCFDALFTQKLLLPREVSCTGKIKSCGPNPLFIQMITEAAPDEALFLETNQLPADMQLHFSIRNGIRLRNMVESTNSGSTAADGGVVPPKKSSTSEQQMKSMMSFLKHLPSSSSFRLLRVLELEGFKGFKKRHLKNICKIYELKYLSLRDTDVERLPKEMDQLLQLETLDIRGTKVRELNAALLTLKHLLAGRIDYASGQGRGDTVKSDELFTTVRLPKDVTNMSNLEILSHVEVHNSGKELAGVGEKLKLIRKLGMVLCGKKANLNDLFHQIDELNNERLVSLSIRAEPPVEWDPVDGATLTSPPRMLESLTICDVRGWLPARIKELHRLVKITLRGTKLKEGSLAILGSLGSLQCLRLRYRSFAETSLVFGGEGQFGELVELVIEDYNLRSFTFAPGTAPKLGTMVWSFSRMESVSGIKNLVSLRRLELNGAM